MKKAQMDNLISVIVPIYNVGPYLRRCIESIIAQKYIHLQIILVDDGSVDDSAAICDEYQQKDDRIEVVHKKNGGPASARGKGLALAKGEYIGFVDGDDYIDDDFYSNMLKDITEYDVEFVHSAVIRECGGICEISAKYENGVHHIEGKQIDFIKKYMLNYDSTFYMYYGVTFKLFKAELIKSCHVKVPDDLLLGEDMLATCRCILNSKRIYMDTTARYHYVIRDGSLCHQRNFKNLTEQVKLYDNLLKIFQEYGVRDQIQGVLDELFQTRFIMFFANLSLERNIHIYYFPSINKIRGKKIVIYCAGKVGQDYYAQICRYRDIEVVAWTDKNNNNYKFDYTEVVAREDIINIDADYWLIATLNDQSSYEIRQELIDMGIKGEKIIWERPQKIHY